MTFLPLNSLNFYFHQLRLDKLVEMVNFAAPEVGP